MNEDKKSPPTVEAESSLSYSYWLGTFIIRGSVAPRVLLDVLGFGALTSAIVIAIQISEKLLGKSLSVPAGPFEAAGAVLGLLLVLRVNTGYSRCGIQRDCDVTLRGSWARHGWVRVPKM